MVVRAHSHKTDRQARTRAHAAGQLPLGKKGHSAAAWAMQSKLLSRRREVSSPSGSSQRQVPAPSSGQVHPGRICRNRVARRRAGQQELAMRQTVGHSGLANMTLPEKRMMLRIHCMEALGNENFDKYRYWTGTLTLAFPEADRTATSSTTILGWRSASNASPSAPLQFANNVR